MIDSQSIIYNIPKEINVRKARDISELNNNAKVIAFFEAFGLEDYDNIRVDLDKNKIFLENGVENEKKYFMVTYSLRYC